MIGSVGIAVVAVPAAFFFLIDSELHRNFSYGLTADYADEHRYKRKRIGEGGVW